MNEYWNFRFTTGDLKKIATARDARPTNLARSRNNTAPTRREARTVGGSASGDHRRRAAGNAEPPETSDPGDCVDSRHPAARVQAAAVKTVPGGRRWENPATPAEAGVWRDQTAAFLRNFLHGLARASLVA
ncbi:hypothetical protein Raf01_87340 [Rugosimonospora africana]|uniref:Uncharacterized protein n=1 Tax=Rugosimonospora africana TaxID=556532 RepID=A0A8J3VVE4_9ACTN|nr:hypothetical protein Raf01_87340 [Rugosimonospora africana]